jgi:hypothetical protein
VGVRVEGVDYKTMAVSNDFGRQWHKAINPLMDFGGGGCRSTFGVRGSSDSAGQMRRQQADWILVLTFVP